MTKYPKLFFWLPLIAILGVGLVLRLHHLGLQSLWMDELLDYYTSRLDLLGMLAGVRDHRGGLPLHYFLEFLSLRVLGNSEFSLRLLPAIFSTLSIGAVFALAREVFPGRRAVAWLTAVMTALAVFQVRYAQEARFYALFELLTLMQWWCFFRALRLRTARAWVLYAGIGVLSAYAHYFTFLVLFCQGVILGGSWLAAKLRDRGEVAADWWRIGRAQVLAAVSVGIAFIPCALIYTSKEAPYGIFQFGGGTFTATFRLLTGGTSAWLACVPLALWFLPEREERKRGLWVGLSLVGLGLGVIGVDAWRGYFFHVRQVLFLQPLMFLVFSAALTALLTRAGGLWRSADARTVERTSLALGLVVVLALLTPILFRFKTDTKPDGETFIFENQKPRWREAAQYVAERIRPGGLVVCLDSLVKKALDYNFQRLGRTDIPVAEVNYDLDAWRGMLDQGAYDDHWYVDGDVFDHYLWRLKPSEQAWVLSQYPPVQDWYLMHVHHSGQRRRTPLPEEIDIEFGQRRARMFKVDGWWDEAPEDGRTAAWSRGGRSVLIVPLADRFPRTLRLSVKPIVPLRMSMWVNGQEVGTLDLGRSEWQEAQLAVSRAPWRTGNNRIEMRYSQSRRYHRLARTRAVCWERCDILFRP
jgi:hypothetical protein